MNGANLFVKGISMVTAAVLFSTGVALAQGKKKVKATADSSIFIDFGSDKKFNLSIHAGYALALGSGFKFYPDDVSSVSVDVVERNVPSKSVTYNYSSKGLGQGIRGGVGISYILNDFMNVGLDVDFSNSIIRKKKDSTFHQSQTVNNFTTDYLYISKSDVSYSAPMISFMPSITFKAITRENYLLYNKVGLVVVFRPKSVEKEAQKFTTRITSGNTVRDSNGTGFKRYEWAIRNPALGLATSIGAQLKLTERIRGFCEIQFSHVVFVARKRSLISYIINGENLTNTLSINKKELIFLNSFTARNGAPDPNTPAEAITEYIPITYAGLQLGLTYRF